MLTTRQERVSGTCNSRMMLGLSVQLGGSLLQVPHGTVVATRSTQGDREPMMTDIDVKAAAFARCTASIGDVR